MFIKFILLTGYLLAFSHGETSVVVSTLLGKVKGQLKESRGGRPFSAFEGIPYAKPPIGDRRFKDPEPIDPWSEVLDASQPTECAQSLMRNPKASSGTEDCLHLNIYVPRDVPSSKFAIDVIVHIHGGAFIWGSGHGYTDAQFLMDHEVILVTFNYRLGILGFLSTEDDAASGNMGLKDQVLALKWVQENIKKFGGDPKSVTLTGLSAGGGSTHLHYFSEMSKGLFHRGFAQSGTALNPWAIQENPLRNAQKLAGLVNCPEGPSEVLVECLRGKPWEELLAQMGEFYVYMFLPAVPFGPVIEKGSSPFLTEHPYNLLKKKQVLDVTLLASHTSHEGSFPVTMFTDLELINKKWSEWAPLMLEFSQTLPESQWESAAQKIKDYYIGEGENITQEKILPLMELFGDRLFYVDAEEALLLQAGIVKSPVYYFKFSYPGSHNEAKVVGHGGEAKYYFGPKIFDTQELSADELKMKDLMVELMVSYAKTGVPQLRGLLWPFVEGNKLAYVEIGGFTGKDVKSRKPLDSKKRDFWKSLGFKENENLDKIREEL